MIRAHQPGSEPIDIPETIPNPLVNEAVTVTVLATVGFGDITAKTDPARLVVTIQMVADLILIAVVVRLILGAASRAGRREAEDEDEEPDES